MVYSKQVTTHELKPFDMTSSRTLECPYYFHTEMVSICEDSDVFRKAPIGLTMLNCLEVYSLLILSCKPSWRRYGSFKTLCWHIVHSFLHSFLQEQVSRPQISCR